MLLNIVIIWKMKKRDGFEKEKMLLPGQSHQFLRLFHCGCKGFLIDNVPAREKSLLRVEGVHLIDDP